MSREQAILDINDFVADALHDLDHEERVHQRNRFVDALKALGVTDDEVTSALKASIRRVAERVVTGRSRSIPIRSGAERGLSRQEVMLRTVELLGFEPDNHHNAMRCPYCTPADRVTIQLEPDRAKRLLEVLRSAGAHPSGLGSYDLAADALELAVDIENMVDR